LQLGTPRSFGVPTGAVPPVFTPDGRTVLSVSGNGILLLWDAADGKAIRQFQGPSKQVHALAVSPDGKLVALAGTKGIHLLQLPDCNEVGNIDVPRGPTLTVAFSAAGDRIASGGRDGAVLLWDVATRKEHKRLTDHKGPVRGVGFSPDSRVIYSTSEDGMLRVTEAESAKVLFQRETRPFEVNRLAVSPSGEFLITAGKRTIDSRTQGVTEVWVTKSARIASMMTSPDELTSVAYAPDGKVIAAAGPSRVHLLDGPSGRILMQFPAGKGLSGGGVAVSPDGKTIAATGAGAAVRLWDVATGKRRGEGLGSTGGESSLAFSPDGKRLATGSVGDWGERDVRVWDLRNGTPVLTLKGHEGNVRQVVFAPDGSRVLTGGNDGILRVWDAASGKELDSLKFHARLLGISAEGKTLTAVGADSPATKGMTTFLVRDLVGKKTLIHRQESKTANVVALSPDEKLGVEGQQAALRLFEVAPGRPRALLAVSNRAGANTLLQEASFSADGRFLAGVSLGRPAPGKEAGIPGGVHLWEVCSGQEVATIKTGTTRPHALALSADGRLVAGAAVDGIHVWDTISGNEVHQFPAAPSDTSALLYSPREDRLASAHLDGTTLLWDLTSARTAALKSAAQPDAKALPGLWDDLAADAAKGQKATWALVAGGEASVAFMEERLQPFPEEKLRQVEKYLADLNSDRFAVREKASKALEQLSDLAETPLRNSLASGPPLEVRRRIEALLARLTVVRSPETLRSLRAIQALERIGSPGARQLLQRMAGGAALARETVEARAALARLRRAGESP
jgi:WD40 repeat protein